MTDQTTQLDIAKRHYLAPTLEDIGTIQDVTLNGPGSGVDGGADPFYTSSLPS